MMSRAAPHHHPQRLAQQILWRAAGRRRRRTLEFRQQQQQQRLLSLWQSSSTTTTASSSLQDRRLFSPTTATVVRPPDHTNNIGRRTFFSTPSSSPATTTSSLSWWNNFVASSWLWASKRVKAPKGFEDFFPPDGMVDEDKLKKHSKTASGTQMNTPKFQTSNDNNKNQQKNGKKNKDSPPPPPLSDDNANLPGLLALLALILAVRQYLDNEEAAKGEQEITWVDFRNQFLNRGLVEKLVVVNQKLVQVVLKPNAVAHPNHLLLGASSSSSAAAASSSGGADHDWHALEQQGKQQHTPTDDPQDVTERFELTHLDTTDATTTSLSSSAQRGGGSRRGKNIPKYYFYIGSVENLEEKLTKAQQNQHPEHWVEVQYTQHTNWALELLKTAPFVAFVAALYFGTRGLAGSAGGGAGGRGGVFGIGKSNAKKIRKEDVSVRFADVAGCDEAKREIMEFVDFLKDSDRFTKLGAKIPKGALLCGPPGTGKTLLAKATAGEAGVPFYSISGSDFIEMFVGVGPSRVRDLFKEARANAPCIVFIDEIDAVGRQRGRGGFSGGNDERENTLNQLLVEMDGFSPSTGVVVLAGTNRADILDQALTRPGRFDRQVMVDKPDLTGRKEIFEVHLKGITLEGEIEDYAGRLAGLTPGFAGADIANICNEAAIVAARRKAESVSIQDFEKATDRIIGGLESNKIMSQEERSIVAHHEAGHAVAGWFLEHADPLLKVTIIPRTSGALGFAQYLPKEVFLRSQEQIMDIVCMALAGRASEEVFFGRVTTGASDDLKRVTQLVYSTIKDYGMNSKVGQLSFPTDSEQFGDKPYSDSTAEAMDDEARSIVDAAYQRTVDLIREKKEQVDQVANLLLEKETITHDDMVDLLGKRPFEGNSAYDEYVSSRAGAAAADAKKKSNDGEAYGLDDPEAPGPENLTPGLA